MSGVVYHRIPEIVVPGKPLGRHYKWDSRNDAYLFTVSGPVRRTPTLFRRRIPILNQGQVGSCTGNEQTGVLGTDPFFITIPANLTLDESFALMVYSGAENIDGDGPYPPNDNGSTGQSAAQYVLNQHLISGYQHATDVNSMATALQSGPVGIGINWYSSFDAPNASGVITIAPGAYVRGGHEVEVRGVDPDAQMFYADNSWGTSWATNGSFQIPYVVMDRLFSEGGDCTVCIPITSPAPTPSPVSTATVADKALYQVAGPWAQGPRARSDLRTLKAAILQWEADSGLTG